MAFSLLRATPFVHVLGSGAFGDHLVWAERLRAGVVSNAPLRTSSKNRNRAKHPKNADAPFLLQECGVPRG